MALDTLELSNNRNCGKAKWWPAPAYVKEQAVAATQGSYGSAQMSGNTSGQGANAVVPAEIQGLNWGAFLLNWIWGIGNSTWLALLALVPGLNLIMAIVLLLKGNEWAWRNKQWDSVEHFKATQRKWMIAGLVILAIGILFGCLSAVLGGLAGSGSTAP